jgi:AraC-like DNA-binding protein
MKNLFSLFDLLLLFGMAQGIITSVLLFLTKKNHKSNKFLAFALIAFCLSSSKMLFNTLGLYQIQYLKYFPLGIEYSMAPLLYFYVVSLITPNFKFQKRHLLHFIPLLVFQSYAFFIYFKALGVETNVEKDTLVLSLWYTPIKKGEDYLIVPFIISYLIAGYYKLKEYRQKLNDSISDNTYPTFNWLIKIFVLTSIVGLINFVNLLLDFVFNLNSSHSFHWQALYLYIAFLIYYLGFVGYQQPNFEIKGLGKSEKSVKTLNKEKFNSIKKLLIKSLEIDKVFLNPTLNAKALAKKLSISQANLSIVVNQSFNKNFRDLINHYRLEEFKTKLNKLDHSHFSILSLALDCGFNSEASFYRIFKKQTGMSPKEFAKS